MALSKSTWVKAYGVVGFLWIDKPPAVFKARANVPGGQIYPTRELVFDGVTLGAYTDVKAGQTVLLGTTDGGDDLGRQRVKSAHPTNLQIGWSSLGEHDGEVIIPDNAYITVIDMRQVWAKIPLIEIASGTAYKDQDQGWVDGDFAQPPVANLGVWYANFVDPITNVITVGFNMTNSYATYPSTLLGSVLWGVADGTITVGVATDQIITATFPPGRRYVSVTITDANGQSHTAYALVVAATPTGANAPIYDFDASFQNTAEGTKATFTVREPIPVSEYPDGTSVIYWENEYYDGVLGSLAGQTGRQHVRFCGWIDTEPTSIAANETHLETSVTLECLDVAGKLAKLPGFPQVVSRKAAPANWYEMYTANADRFIHYLLHWHSTALTLTDFYISGTGDTYAFGSFTSDGANLYSQVDGRAQATGTGYRLTSDSQGIIRIVPDPQFQETGDRTATVIVALDEDDISDISYTKTRPPRYHWLRASALTVTTNEITAQNVVFSIAPGAAPGQGESAQEVGNRLVINQAQLNVFTGNKYARDNAPESTFDIELTRGGFAGIDPALMEWVTITTTAINAAQRGLFFTAERFLPLSISRRYDSKAGTVAQSFTGELEVVGQIAATYIPPTANLPGYTPPSEYFGEVLDTADTGFSGGTGNLAFFATDGYLYRTSSISASAPVWERLNLALNGVITSFVVNAYSPLYLGTGSTVNGWVSTHKCIYGIADIFGTATPTLQHTFNAVTIQSVFESQYWATNLASERGVQNLVACSINYSGATGGSGTSVAVTTNGTTWTEQNLSTTSTVGGGVDAIGIAVSAKVAGMIYIAVITATSGGTLYKSVNSGATFSSTGKDITPIGNECSCIHLPFANNPTDSVLLVSRGVTPRSAAVFDGSTFTDITPLNSASAPNDPYNFKAISTSPLDRNYIVLIGQSATGVALYTSDDGGTSWIQRTSEMTYGVEWTGVEMLDNPAQIYVFGYEFIGFSVDNGSNTLDKTGNIPDEFGPIGRVISIVGG